MHRGYIKIWRKTLDSPIFSNPHCLILSIYLLIKANYKETRFIFNKQEITINRGQCIVGRKALSIETGLSEQVIRSTLTILKNTQFLTIQATNRFSIITICNYETYQSNENEDNQQITNKQPTDNQQITTSKELISIKRSNTEVIKKPSPAQQAYTAFLDKYKIHTGLDYVPAWGKHCKLLKPIIDNMGKEEYLGCITSYFDSSKGEGVKYSFDYFISSINTWRSINVF